VSSRVTKSLASLGAGVLCFGWGFFRGRLFGEALEKKFSCSTLVLGGGQGNGDTWEKDVLALRGGGIKNRAEKRLKQRRGKKEESTAKAKAAEESKKSEFRSR